MRGAAMRVLVVQNFEDGALASSALRLPRQMPKSTLRPYQGEELPQDASGHDALIVLGGGQNALDDAICPYFPSLLALMRDFGDGGRAVLGVCLGSQLLARAYGAENLLGAAPEFGWHIDRVLRRGKSTLFSVWRRKLPDLPVARRHLHPA